MIGKTNMQEFIDGRLSWGKSLFDPIKKFKVKTFT